jgi:hypothetical protein
LASCYRDLKDYTTATNCYQTSIEKHQALGSTENTAIQLRQLSHTQRRQAKDSPRDSAVLLLQQAAQNLQQAIQLDTTNDYCENLAYDQITLALITAEKLRWLPTHDATRPELIAQFEQATTEGSIRFADLGQTVNSADEALDIARAYLKIAPLKDLDKAEALASQSLQTFQAFNRRKLQAEAHKLLGEIHLARAAQNNPAAQATEHLAASLQLYRDLDLTQKATEVEHLMASVVTI